MSRRKPVAPRERGEGHIIIGRNTVREVLNRDPERIEALLVARDGLDAEGTSLVERARALGIEIEPIGIDDLLKRSGSASHQSIAAVVRPRVLPSLKEFLAGEESRESSLILMLDSIQDPHNFGAIMRAAECFGVSALVWSKNRGASVTPTVSKASVGASELVTLIEVSNLVEAAGRCKDAGFWLVGAEVRDGATELAKFEFPKKMVLVLGSEGEGIHALLRKQLDYSVFVPLVGQIDSLNVSQAAAVMLYAAGEAAKNMKS